MEELKVLEDFDGMRRVPCDQCQFGVTSVDDAGNVGPARKATGFMTNDEYIAEAVNRDCFGGHDHIQLLHSQQATLSLSLSPRTSPPVAYEFFDMKSSLVNQELAPPPPRK